tara:strand:- start:230 stop:1240 length:1011 start_codon:yes stop_codon:yes gene_type:complete
MQDYKSASYQFDFIVALKRISQVNFYGPGFNIYNKKDNLNDILKKINIHIDCIFIGHSWLSDKNEDFSVPNTLNLKELKIPKFIFLNKEYVNLQYKLQFISDNKFDACFTHHNNISFYKNKTKIPFYFIPFAFNSSRLHKEKYNKKIDIFFSGILKNQNRNNLQTNYRVNVMNSIFITFLNIKFSKRKFFSKYNIFWNSIPNYKISKIISKFLNQYKYLDDNKYDKLIKNSKIVINSLSPMGLVSPRYYETMATRSIIFSEKSEKLTEIIPSKYIIYSENNNTSISNQLLNILNNYKKYESILDEAQQYVFDNHTWDHRAQKVLKIIHNKVFDNDI